MDVFQETERYFEQSMSSLQRENMDNEELTVFSKAQVSDEDETKNIDAFKEEDALEERKSRRRMWFKRRLSEVEKEKSANVLMDKPLSILYRAKSHPRTQRQSHLLHIFLMMCFLAFMI